MNYIIRFSCALYILQFSDNCQEAAEKIHHINRVMSTVVIVRENIRHLRDYSVDLCLWLYCNLSSDDSSAKEAFILNELKRKDGYCTSEWSRYTGHRCLN